MKAKSIISLIFIFVLTTFLFGCAQISKEKPRVIKHRQPVHAVYRPHLTQNLQKVAVFLPLSGALADQSLAIKNGFLAAYYSGQKAGTASFDIKFVDTTNQNIISLYNNEVEAGTNLIIGPLQKPDVEQLASSAELPIPVIALNTADNYKNKVKINLYQFGLSTQDEAIVAASKIIKDGHFSTALIYPSVAWGETLAAAFRNKYSALGGHIVAEMRYDNSSNVDAQIRQLMGISETDFNNNKKRHAELAHRTDIDAVFLIAYPQKARQIVPLLKFYYAENIPMYATSMIYSGTPNPGVDQDLDGVKFADMPWVIDSPATLPQYLQDVHNNLTASSPQSFAKNSRLYALGVDAYTLTTNFNTLITTPHAGIAGATGTLHLDNYNHIYRRLHWTKFQQGLVNY